MIQYDDNPNNGYNNMIQYNANENTTEKTNNRNVNCDDC